MKRRLKTDRKRLTEGLSIVENPAYTAALLERKGSGVVNLCGVIHAGPWHAEAAKEPVADIAAALLDEGTVEHSRDSYRLSLEKLGAQVNFWASDRYLFFSVLATSKHISDAVSFAFEALQTPLISENSVREVISREAALRVQAAENTNGEAHRALTRLLYATGSAGYSVKALDEKEAILRLAREDVLVFLKEQYRGRVVLAAVGDVDTKTLEKILTKNTSEWNAFPGASVRAVQALESTDTPREEVVFIPGKESADVYIGSVIRVPPSDPSFSALRVGVDLLGGGFTDHLMQTIRDRDGLTYGTLARIYGRENQAGLHFAAWAMFGNSVYKKGRAALEREFGIFMKRGVTQKQLEQKIEEIEGRYAVMFSKPSSALMELRSGMLSVGNPANVDSYIDSLHMLSAQDVNLAVRKHLRIDAVASAGTVDTK
jgi:zinc protease